MSPLQRIGIGDLFQDVSLSIAQDGLCIRLFLGKARVRIPYECITITETRRGLFQYIELDGNDMPCIGLQARWIGLLKNAQKQVEKNGSKKGSV
jgi:hypothetical protein